MAAEILKVVRVIKTPTVEYHLTLGYAVPITQQVTSAHGVPGPLRDDTRRGAVVAGMGGYVVSRTGDN